MNNYKMTISDLTDKYKMLFEQMEKDYKRVFRSMGLDDIIDINSIESPNIVIEQYSPSIGGKFYPEKDKKKIKIGISKELIDYYFECLGGGCFGFESVIAEILLYHSFIHEWIHYIRWLIIYEDKKLYHKYLENTFMEELITEAISDLLLSKKFGKENIERLLERSIGLYAYNLITTMSPHIFGDLLGYLILKMNEDKQKGYAKELIQIYEERDLERLLNDIENYLPSGEYKIIAYYKLGKRLLTEKLFRKEREK